MLSNNKGIMDRELRIIIRNNHDCDGITESIINQFKEYFSCVSGIVLDCNMAPRARDEAFTYINACSFSTHDNKYIRSAKLPIDGDILEKMLPYKSMAMHIMMRTLHYDVFDRRYLENSYYAHLKYWNQLLVENDINYVLFMCIPHHVGEYILYALCKVKGIKTTLLDPQLSYKGILYHLGTDIETFGENVEREYHRLSDKEVSFNELSEFMRGVVDNTRNNKVIGAQNWDKIQAESKRLMYSEITKKKLIKSLGRIVLKKLGRHKEFEGDFFINQYRYISRARKYEKRMEHIKDYERMSIFPVKGEKFIYFPLQMTPEASTMPLAGEFKNQILSIEMLSAAASKFDLHVYVKEHWVQYNRDRGFYKKIANIENVRLIDLSCNSINLIEDSVAVASQTGNCLFEALLKGKPAISIGRGNTFKGAPNIVSVMNLSETEKVLSDIVDNKVNVSDKEIYRYLKALDNSMVFSYLDSLEETFRLYSKEGTAKKIALFSKNNFENGSF